MMSERTRLVRIGVGAVAPRPRLWPTAVRVVWRSRARGWWRRPPFLPLPPAEYVGFRLVTQYGDAGAVPTATDVIRYLSWCASAGRVRSS
jgi:hypothetical protein